jgi:UDP-2-acetamido-3-amino-2,3-dideoxy-glucuronate N-acetyltransferase
MNATPNAAAITWYRISDIRLIDLPRHVREDGALVVAEAPHVPFLIPRIFTITAPAGAVRSKHAHRLCSQLIVCVHGKIDIVCDDGTSERTITLDRGDLGALMPPTIWTTVIVRQQGSVLLALCDRRYEPEDYIRDYDEFLAMRRAAQQ